ncbi:hypothetical protein HDU76_000974 [Blyttiomyces sp. JEL0837]|nr:hypothetical protein HDU76_000974 [Blyttiomyces sp. JEL0837]
MISSAIVSFAVLFSSAFADPKVTSPGSSKKIDGSIMVELPIGCDPVREISEHLDSKNISYKFRTVTKTHLFCGASLDILDSSNALFKLMKSFAHERVAPLVDHSVIAETNVQKVHNIDENYVEKIHNMTGVTAARAAGFTGKGIKVAILDTGIYYLHPALSGGFGPGFKVSFGYDVVGDNYIGGTSTPIPDDDPFDNCQAESHGTHVAGIVGANAFNITSFNPADIPQFPFTGVAPDVTLGSFRVFGCSGGNTNDIIASAIYKAADAGAHIINLSLGDGPDYSRSLADIAVDRVSQQGHIVVSAGGNDGAAGAFTTSSPAVAKKGLAFGSNNGKFSDQQKLELVVNTPNTPMENITSDGCLPGSINPAVRNKTILLKYDVTCGSKVRCDNAANAGAIACLLYSDSVAHDSSNLSGSLLIPSAIVRHSTGEVLLRTSNPVVIVNTKKEIMAPIASAGTVSAFSSSGLDPELNFKPDIGGVGGRVLSTISPHAAAALSLTTNYATLSGTSMASPYVAGCIALLLQSDPTLTFEQVRAIMQNTAVPAKIYNTTFVDSIINQGAGLVNIYNTKTIVTPSALALNDTTNTQQQYVIAITNNYKKDVTYTLSAFGAAQANPFVACDDAIQLQITAKYTDSTATITFNDEYAPNTTVKVGAGKSAQVNVQFTPPAGADPSLYPVYSGYIKVSNDVDETLTTVPYVGMVGDWNSAPIFAKNSSTYYNTIGIRGTGIYINNTNTPLIEGYTFNVTSRMDVLKMIPIAATTSRLGYISIIYTGQSNTVQSQLKSLEFDFVCNYYEGIVYGNSSATIGNAASSQGVHAPTALTFSGLAYPSLASVANGESPVSLPVGQYQFRFTALRHFESVPDAFDQKRFDTVYSPKFNLVYKI